MQQLYFIQRIERIGVGLVQELIKQLKSKEKQEKKTEARGKKGKDEKKG